MADTNETSTQLPPGQEPVFCYVCMRVMPCIVATDGDRWTWHCTACGSLADVDWIEREEFSVDNQEG